MSDAVTKFYLQLLPKAKLTNAVLQAACPFCSRQEGKKDGILTVYLNQESFFHGYFRCLNRCVPGGFPLHFARLSGISPTGTPGFDPDRDYFGREVDFPVKNINHELIGFNDKLTEESLDFFAAASISPEVLTELQIGYNGRYLVYPYTQADGNCYSARCVHPERSEDFFWYGDERFSTAQFRLFNAPEIGRAHV